MRKNAYSNKFGFSKKQFAYCLESSGIKYIHIPELGIESEKRQELKTAKSSSLGGYDLFENGVKDIENKLFDDYRASLSLKQAYTNKLLQILEQDNLIAITCFEVDYKCCHRHVLAQSLSGIEVVNL